MGIRQPREYRASSSAPCLADLQASKKLQQLVASYVPRNKTYSQRLVDGHETGENTLVGAPAADVIENDYRREVAKRFEDVGASVPMESLRPKS